MIISFTLKIMSKKFDVIKNNSTTSKNFSFSKGAVSLNFTLRNDVKTELKDFAKLLKVAQEEVNKKLTKI